MLFPVRQRLRFTLPVGLLITSLGVNATASAVNAMQVAELVSACGRSTVIAANQNGMGKVRLVADALRMTNELLAFFNHSGDGAQTSYLYNGYWFVSDVNAFRKHLQATMSDESTTGVSSTEQAAEEAAGRLAQVLLKDVLPAVETVASVWLAVDGMANTPEHKKLRTILQSITSWSRTLQLYAENRNTPEARRYLVFAVAHTVLSVCEFFRDFGPKQENLPVFNSVSPVAVTTTTPVVVPVVEIPKPAEKVEDKTPVTETKAAVVIAEQKEAMVTDVKGEAASKEATVASDATTSLSIVVTPPTEQSVAPVAASVAPVNVATEPLVVSTGTSASAPEIVTRSVVEPVVSSSAPLVTASSSMAVSTGNAATTASVVTQEQTPASGSVSPRANTPEDKEEIGMDKPTRYIMGNGSSVVVVEQKKKPAKNSRGRRV